MIVAGLGASGVDYPSVSTSGASALKKTPEVLGPHLALVERVAFDWCNHCVSNRGSK